MGWYAPACWIQENRLHCSPGKKTKPELIHGHCFVASREIVWGDGRSLEQEVLPRCLRCGEFGDFTASFKTSSGGMTDLIGSCADFY